MFHASRRGWGNDFGGRTIMHVDMDAFFAQIEVLDNPSYVGQPVVVGGTRDAARGVVSTCTYEARRFGIRSAMPIAQAVKLCPHAIFVPTRMHRYEGVAKQIRQVLDTFSPAVEPLSIDEAFLEMTGCEHFYRDAKHMGQQLKALIHEATGLTSSVGIAPNKFMAKLASDNQKPDGLVIIDSDRVKPFLLTLPVTSIWGVGPKTAERLLRVGIRTVSDVRNHGLERLCETLGDRTGHHIYELAFGRDDRPVEPAVDAKSIGRETTFDRDIPEGQALRSHLARLAANVGWRMRRSGVYARTITVKIRFPDFETHTKSRSFNQAFHDDDTLFNEASTLLNEFRLRRPLRLLGIYASHLQEQRQSSLFDEPADQLGEVIDTLNLKLGTRAVRKGREL